MSHNIQQATHLAREMVEHYSRTTSRELQCVAYLIASCSAAMTLGPREHFDILVDQVWKMVELQQAQLLPAPIIVPPDAPAPKGKRRG